MTLVPLETITTEAGMATWPHPPASLSAQQVGDTDPVAAADPLRYRQKDKLDSTSLRDGNRNQGMLPIKGRTT